MKVGFIGLGKLGFPCAEFLAKEHEMEGYDIEKRYSRIINIVDSIEKVVKNKELVFIAVPTPHDPEYGGEEPTSHLPAKDFDYSILKNVVIEADKYMNNNQTLVIISTVLPGTIREQIAPLVKNVKLLYNPYLIAMGTVRYDMQWPEMIIIGSENGAGTETLEKFYNEHIFILKKDFKTGTWEEAESIKIFFNTYVSMKLSFVNMIQDVAENLGNMDVDVVIDALTSSSKLMNKYFKPGMGDGGSCHPRDNIALSHLSQRLGLGYDLFGTITRAREVQAENMANRMIRVHLENNKKPMYIHGATYKPYVNMTAGSYSLLVKYYIEAYGYQVTFIDPTMTHPMNEPKEPCVMLMAHSGLREHSKEVNFYCNIPKDSVIIDPWREMASTDDYTVIHYGDTRS